MEPQTAWCLLLQSSQQRQSADSLQQAACNKQPVKSGAPRRRGFVYSVGDSSSLRFSCLFVFEFFIFLFFYLCVWELHGAEGSSIYLQSSYTAYVMAVAGAVLMTAGIAPFQSARTPSFCTICVSALAIDTRPSMSICIRFFAAVK